MSVNFGMSFWWLQFLPKNKQKHVDQGIIVVKVIFFFGGGKIDDIEKSFKITWPLVTKICY